MFSSTALWLNQMDNQIELLPEFGNVVQWSGVSFVDKFNDRNMIDKVTFDT
jgi:hypothetical protein